MFRAEWQPIDSAPKNGKSVLVAAWHMRAAVPDLVVGEAYCDAEDHGGGAWYWANTNWGDVGVSAISASGWVVTHWMPLPDPPRGD